MFTIFGSGFGLYGYLPALVDVLKLAVALPERYRTLIESRSELRSLASAVRWSRDHEEALKWCDTVVIAVPPLAQDRILKQCLMHRSIQRIVLEKPIAPDPRSGDAALDELAARQIHYAIGYTLTHCRWAQQVRQLEDLQHLTIDWRFMAHHFSQGIDNWKRTDANGGGVLHFYGTHVLALLAQMGYDRVTESSHIGISPGQSERWEARLHGRHRPSCVVCVDSRSEHTQFRISGHRETGEQTDIVSLSEPFELEPLFGNHDRRVSAVASVIRCLDADRAIYETEYRQANRLWLQAAQLR
jgi:predicted dehydrogenase